MTCRYPASCSAAAALIASSRQRGGRRRLARRQERELRAGEVQRRDLRHGQRPVVDRQVAARRSAKSWYPWQAMCAHG